MSSMPPSRSSEPAPEEARMLRTLLDGLPALIGYWDRDLHNVVANTAYVEWFGIHPDDMRGRHLREIVGEKVYAQNEPHIRRALDGGGTQQFVRTLIDAEGHTR